MTTKVKGAALDGRRAFVCDDFGEAAWQRVLEALPEEDRSILESRALTSSWVSFELNQRLDEAIVGEVGNGDPAVFDALGARSARRNLSGPHRAYLSAGDPQRLLAKTDSLFKVYYDTGYRTYEPTGPTSGIITTHDAESFSITDCRTIIGWHREALLMCGAKQVHIQHPECRAKGGACCRYEVSWET